MIEGDCTGGRKLMEDLYLGLHVDSNNSRSMMVLFCMLICTYVCTERIVTGCGIVRVHLVGLTPRQPGYKQLQHLQKCVYVGEGKSCTGFVDWVPD